MARRHGLLERRAVSPRNRLFISAKEAARALGVNIQTIYRMIERGELVATRAGNRIKIPRQEFCDQYRIPDDYDFDEE